MRDAFFAPDVKCSHRLPSLPRLRILGAFKTRDGKAMDVQLIPDTDAQHKLILPLRWVLPGSKSRDRKALATTEQVQEMALCRGYRTQVVM